MGPSAVGHRPDSRCYQTKARAGNSRDPNAGAPRLRCLDSEGLRDLGAGR